MPKKAQSRSSFNFYKISTLGLLAVLAILAVNYFWIDEADTPATKSTIANDLRAELEDNYNHAVGWQNSTGETKEFQLSAHELETEIVPGYRTKIWSYGGSAEPLVLRVQKGDRVKITITNNLPAPTTIHWHGLRVPNSEDGVPELTQPVIEPGDSHTYDFVLNDLGTFWFHPHESASEQIGRGLYAVLIVEEATPPKFDQDWLWPLKDYRLSENGALAGGFDNLHDAVHGGYFGNLATIGNQINPIFIVTRGDRVRIRIVNTSNARPYQLDLTGWQAEVIATDGGYTAEPYAVNSLEVHPGERYELAVRFTEATEKNLSVADNYFGSSTPLAEIRYSGSAHEPSELELPTAEIPDWSALRSATPDQIIRLGGTGVMGGSQGGMMMDGSSRAWTLNDGAYPDSHTPLKLKLGQLTKLRLQNESRRIHPIHLHGDFFQVLSVNGVSPESRAWKDTVNVEPLGFVDIAILPTNPGVWALHCHILEHAELGMFTTVTVE